MHVQVKFSLPDLGQGNRFFELQVVYKFGGCWGYLLGPSQQRGEGVGGVRSPRPRGDRGPIGPSPAVLIHSFRGHTLRPGIVLAAPREISCIHTQRPPA